MEIGTGWINKYFNLLIPNQWFNRSCRTQRGHRMKQQIKQNLLPYNNEHVHVSNNKVCSHFYSQSETQTQKSVDSVPSFPVATNIEE